MQNIKNTITSCVVLLFLFTTTAFAQKAERSFIRKGNRQYKDSVFVEAETNYHKALDANPTSTDAMYNLGNALLLQNNPKDAMEQYVAASKIEKNKNKLAQIYHNIGVIQHSNKDFAKAIEAYKMALRNNPKDDETRYNLSLAMKQLQQQQNQEQNEDKKDQEEEQKKQEQQENQDKEQQQNEQNQNQQQEQKENNMSKENAEQLLKSVMQDERDVQDKVKKMQVIQGGKLEKDW